MKTKKIIDKKIKKIREADILISIFFILGCLWIAYESIRMSYEMYSKQLSTIYTIPGLLPLIVSISIIFCAIRVLIKSIQSGANLNFLQIEKLKETFSDLNSFTAIIVMGLMCVYVFLLIGNIPFVIATIIFTSVLMFIFKATKPTWIIIISTIFSIGIVFFFSRVVSIDFPKGIF